MNTIAIDTHKLITKLESRGFTKAQAEGVVEVLTESDLVTNDTLRGEFKDLRIELANMRALLIQWVAVLLVAQSAAIVALQELIR